MLALTPPKAASVLESAFGILRVFFLAVLNSSG